MCGQSGVGVDPDGDGRGQVVQRAGLHVADALAVGTIECDEIECPLHGGAFNIRTGEPVAFPVVVPVETYGVRIEGDEIQVVVKP